MGDRRGAPRAAARHPRAGAAEPLRRPGPAARRRHRRLGRRLARHGRPREPRAGLAALDVLRAATEAAGHALAPRLTIYPAVRPRPRALARPGACASRVLDCSDAEGLARERPPGARAARRARRRSSDPEPGRGRRQAVWRAGRGSAVREVLAGVALGQEVGEDEIVTLFSARGPEVRLVAEVADGLRRDTVGDDVTFVHNRNINYTNVCTFKCRFCAFSKGPLSLNLRGAPYLLDLDEIARPRRRGRGGGRDRGVPPGRHPPELRRRLLRARAAERCAPRRSASTSTASPRSR